MSAILFVCCITLIFLLPIVLSVKIDFDLEDKKIVYVILIYKFKIIKGEATFTNKKIILRANKKIVKYPYNAIVKKRTGLKSLKGFTICSLKAKLNLSDDENVLEALMFANAYNVFATTFITNLKNKNPLFDAHTTVNVYEGIKCFNFYLKISILFNLLMLLVALARILWGKLFDGKRKNKQN